ncbi:uncharacterized protein AMSG_05152 [Thecamonas trahens ATCC 50062]|uniref:Uncharacterized protein n=1 Tax=Thecamonas trahens ATCC 50062 TaxID=461836 RepID=A0A0L0DCX4_THETB|nr:hypothetical protein AMSG_05152 [Thecamonas trahens ATCC 50062]KNC49173.1 hypothetical protein AMSG_05152 [Thecamonas trahens ATCC 50062]|eukprot:XP_013758193.1 hypothetical protein AMSG_05152 [Thecamonas trahens ATCC 50062]
MATLKSFFSAAGPGEEQNKKRKREEEVGGGPQDEQTAGASGKAKASSLAPRSSALPPPAEAHGVSKVATSPPPAKRSRHAPSEDDLVAVSSDPSPSSVVVVDDEAAEEARAEADAEAELEEEDENEGHGRTESGEAAQAVVDKFGSQARAVRKERAVSRNRRNRLPLLSGPKLFRSKAERKRLRAERKARKKNRQGSSSSSSSSSTSSGSTSYSGSSSSSSSSSEPEHAPVVPLIAEGEQPRGMAGGKLHPHQRRGINFMLQHHNAGVSSILADEMGLGKTLQAIAFLLHITENSNGRAGPHLIVVPVSLLPSWKAELRRWAPSLRVAIFHGTASERDKVMEYVMLPMDFDVAITTAETLSSSLGKLRTKFVWHYIVFDEAHRIKNPRSNISKNVRRLKSVSRLLLTGTPVQNSLHELWAMINYAFPIFSSPKPFKALPTRSSASATGYRKDTLEAAAAMLDAILLRRTKAVVAASIPPKTEVRLSIPLTTHQHAAYALAVDQARRAAIARKEGRSSDAHSQWLATVQRLRQLASAPSDAELPSVKRLVARSGKLAVVLHMVRAARDANAKILVFSQFTTVLDVVESMLEQEFGRGFHWLRLDGTTPLAKRSFDVSRFNDPKCRAHVYLLSTRAAGLGLSLTSASTVVLLDSAWNPHVDVQAQDRAHRIGQDQPVTIYRLSTRGTIDEHVLAVADAKLLLHRDTVAKDEELAVALDDDSVVQSATALPAAEDAVEPAALVETNVPQEMLEAARAAVGLPPQLSLPVACADEPDPTDDFTITTPMPARRKAGDYFAWQSLCHGCRDGGSLVCCDACPRVFHPLCAGETETDPEKLRSGMRAGYWRCPQHRCGVCTRSAADGGGLLFVCKECPWAYCLDDLPLASLKYGHWGRDAVLEALGYGKSPNIHYILCSATCQAHFKAGEAAALAAAEAAAVEAKTNATREAAAKAEALATAEADPAR